MDIMSIAHVGFGTFLGLAIGVLLRFILIKVFIIIAVPAAVLFFLDYTGFYIVPWLKLDGKWQEYVIPPAINIYHYFNHHVLLGILPGVIIGLSLGFILSRKLV